MAVDLVVVIYGRGVNDRSNEAFDGSRTPLGYERFVDRNKALSVLLVQVTPLTRLAAR